MLLQSNVNLAPYNTFHIHTFAEYFTCCTSLADIEEAIALNPKKLFVLGGGSNVLFTKIVKGLVLQVGIKGITLVGEDDDYFYVKASSGESWHEFVSFCVTNNYAGIENLSAIPGTVGAAPVQNIGAYGVELKDVFYELEAYHIQDKALVVFKKNDCFFGYRDSIFKRAHKGQLIILNVTFRLRKQPVLTLGYGTLENRLAQMGITEPTISAVASAITRIRQSKLPDPARIGNAGSFFKNPIIPNEEYEQLRSTFPDINGHRVNSFYTKVQAGWLIEYCGWKGYKRGDAGCYSNQALILVNHGKATGEEIYLLSMDIIDSVKQTFNITLEREVNVL